MNQLIAAVDVETTGLILGFHEILSIGVAPFDKELPTYYGRLKAEHPERIQAKAMEINKLDPSEGESQGAGAISFLGYVQELFEAFELKHGLVERKLHASGQNFGGFDALFLKVLLGETRYNDFFSYRYRDLQSAAALAVGSGVVKLKSIKLPDIMQGLALPELEYHHALNDAIMERDAWVELERRNAACARARDFLAKLLADCQAADKQRALVEVADLQALVGL
jgi:DNA polymerase III epsilon subunit-like protein